MGGDRYRLLPLGTGFGSGAGGRLAKRRRRRQCRQPCSADVVFSLCRFGRLSSWFVDGLHERIVYSAFYGQGVDGGGMPENSVAKILESVGVQLVGRLVDGYAYFGTFAKEKRSHAVGGQTGK